jgi:hypothetical protein
MLGGLCLGVAVLRQLFPWNYGIVPLPPIMAVRGASMLVDLNTACFVTILARKHASVHELYNREPPAGCTPEKWERVRKSLEEQMLALRLAATHFQPGCTEGWAFTGEVLKLGVGGSSRHVHVAHMVSEHLTRLAQDERWRLRLAKRAAVKARATAAPKAKTKPKAKAKSKKAAA